MAAINSLICFNFHFGPQFYTPLDVIPGFCVDFNNISNFDEWRNFYSSTCFQFATLVAIGRRAFPSANPSLCNHEFEKLRQFNSENLIAEKDAFEFRPLL